MSMKPALVVLVSMALAASGCAIAPPDTPGAGTGDTYTPFVDLQGVDHSKYQNDLAGCRSYAKQIDVGGEAMKGMIGGMIVGALVGAAIGGNSRSMGYGASAGGGAGLGGASGKAINKQETVIANCLAGRGYRVLEGATIPTNVAAPSPYLPSTAQSATGPAVAHPLELVQPLGTSSIKTAATPTPLGQDAYAAGRWAAQESCNKQPVPVMAAKGPGFETYSVACTSGDTLMIRCEFGNCRSLQ